MSESGWIGRLLLGVGGSVVALALIEGALWSLDVPSSGPFLQEFYGPGFKLMCYDSNPAGAFDIDLRDPRRRAVYEARLANEEFAAHWVETPFAVEVAWNSQRFRDREFAPRGAGVRRVVVVGDSYTYGHGLREGESYPRQLEASLRARGHPATQVLNLGRGGDNLDKIARIADAALKDLNPNVLVYGYFLNDPDWGPATRGPLVHAMLDPGWGHVESSRGRYSLGARPVTGLRTLAAVKRALEARRVTDATLGWYRALHEPDRWAATGERIVSMQRHAERRKVRFVLLILPLIWRLDGEYPLRDVHQRIAAFARSRGIEVVDALPALRGRADAELIVHPRDRHPNGEYSRIVAETLAQTLRDPPEATWMRMRVTAPGAG